MILAHTYVVCRFLHVALVSKREKNLLFTTTSKTMVSALATALSPYRGLPRLLIRNRPLRSSILSATSLTLSCHRPSNCRSSSLGSIMSFHFGSSGYAKCFLNLPQPDTQEIRQSALSYLKSFDSNLWYADPVSSKTQRRRVHYQAM